MTRAIQEENRMKLTMLGTGNALVTECYNTCFVLSDEYGHFLVDGGGGNTVLSQLKKAGIDLMDVHEIFVTHKHVDHIMGIVWVIRIICQNKKKDKLCFCMIFPDLLFPDCDIIFSTHALSPPSRTLGSR